MIEIKNVRVNNLKGIDLTIPRDKFVVITGVSGSGKSSLAFDTLYAEGQRRYVESLSSYVRQFLGRMNKPEVDFIKGLPPAIAIEQKVISNNIRSTVGTTTEIYDYLKLLFARIGITYSPVSGEEVKKHTVDDVVNYILTLPEGTAVLLQTEVEPTDDYNQLFEMLQRQGFARVELDGVITRLSEASKFTPKQVRLIIDRVVVADSNELRNRLYDSIETAFYEGKDSCIVKSDIEEREFSKSFEADGVVFEQPTIDLFSFNSPYGACPNCEGVGKVQGLDINLIIPNKNLSIYEDAIVCWRGEIMSKWKDKLIYNASKFDFPIHKPYYKLSDSEKKLLWTGNRYFEGLNDFFDQLKANNYKLHYRIIINRYMGRTECPVCHGGRLRKEADNVKVAGKTITELVAMSISQLQQFFKNIELSDQHIEISKRLLIEINSRLQFLMDVGLSYLTLNRPSNTLSGGESQRVNLSKSLGSALVGSMYILDEPSIGLHPRDTEKLIKVLRQLQDQGNSVIVVEHDEEIMRAADHIIDIGTNAGRLGGEVVFNGTIEDAYKQKSFSEKSHTINYLNHFENIEMPKFRRKWSDSIDVIAAAENNLKGIDVKFPLNTLTVVTGVSGSGKSTLVREVLYNTLFRYFESDKALIPSNLKGSYDAVANIDFINQNPIGRSSRSNPATYLKAYDEIRRLYADQQLSKQLDFKPAHFSFNTDGGRCEVCQGEGKVTVEMQFMADLVLECEACGGKRFKQEILDVLYRGKCIYDILDMTIDEAVDFFSVANTTIEKNIVKRLKPLQDVGIGYLKMGQSSSTFSGGESQRLKLAYYLSHETTEKTLFIFDEPTTGLHFHDIKRLLVALNALIDRGHSLIVIEHNLEVIKCADWIIDLGQEGGDKGGELIFTGTPEDIVNCAESYTGQSLKSLIV